MTDTLISTVDSCPVYVLNHVTLALNYRLGNEIVATMKIFLFPGSSKGRKE